MTQDSGTGGAMITDSNPPAYEVNGEPQDWSSLTADAFNIDPTSRKSDDIVNLKYGLAQRKINIPNLNVRKLKIECVGFWAEGNKKNQLDAGEFVVNARDLRVDELEIDVGGFFCKGDGSPPVRLAIDLKGARILHSAKIVLRNAYQQLEHPNGGGVLMMPNHSGGFFLRARNLFVGQDMTIVVDSASKECLLNYQGTHNPGTQGCPMKDHVFDAVFDLKQANIGGDLVVERLNDRALPDATTANKPVVALIAPSMNVEDVLRLENVALWNGKNRKRQCIGLDLSRSKIGHLELDGVADDFVPEYEQTTAANGASEPDENISNSFPGGLRQFKVRSATLESTGPAGLRRPSERAEMWTRLTFLQSHGHQQTFRVLAAALMETGQRDVADLLLVEEKRYELRRERAELTPFQRIGGIGATFVFMGLIFFSHLEYCNGRVMLDYSETLQFTCTEVSTFILVSVLTLFVLLIIYLYCRRQNERFPSDSNMTLYLFNAFMFTTIRSGIRPLLVLKAFFIIVIIGIIGTEILAMRGAIVPDRPEITARTSLWHLVDLEYRALPPSPHLDPDANADEEERYEHYTRAMMRSVSTGYSAPFEWRTEGDDTVHPVGPLDEKRHVSPLVHVTNSDIFNVCQYNWARPHQIDDTIWSKIIGTRVQGRLDQLPDKASIVRLEGHGSIEGWLSAKFNEELSDEACAKFLPREYSHFNSSIYVFDVLIPLLDLRLEREWSIRATHLSHEGVFKPSGWNKAAIFVESVFMVLGWLIALVLAGAVTGLSDPRRRPY